MRPFDCIERCCHINVAHSSRVDCDHIDEGSIGSASTHKANVPNPNKQNTKSATRETRDIHDGPRTVRKAP